MNTQSVTLHDIEEIERLARQMRAEMLSSAAKRMAHRVKSAFGARPLGEKQLA